MGTTHSGQDKQFRPLGLWKLNSDHLGLWKLKPQCQLFAWLAWPCKCVCVSNHLGASTQLHIGLGGWGWVLATGIIQTKDVCSRHTSDIKTCHMNDDSCFQRENRQILVSKLMPRPYTYLGLGCTNIIRRTIKQTPAVEKKFTYIQAASPMIFVSLECWGCLLFFAWKGKPHTDVKSPEGRRAGSLDQH